MVKNNLVMKVLFLDGDVSKKGGPLNRHSNAEETNNF